LALLRGQVLTRVRADRDQAADLDAQGARLALDLRGCQLAEAARITGLLERDRRDLGRAEGTRRARRSDRHPPNGIDDPSRAVFGTTSSNQARPFSKYCARKLRELLGDLLAVAIDDLRQLLVTLASPRVSSTGSGWSELPQAAIR